MIILVIETGLNLLQFLAAWITQDNAGYCGNIGNIGNMPYIRLALFSLYLLVKTWFREIVYHDNLETTERDK